ncbi:MAG: hypothetical protein LBJ14_03570 [Desulfarculales bacterium]|jgi:hypothetical protein|nr:hypothetical protein [Desulfarculales bacterium]
MTRLLAIVSFFIFIILTGEGNLYASPDPLNPNYQHLQYFVGTPNELDIYRVYGVRPGKTMMLIGGIQGDEAGGFLSADMYADIALAKGNLIVVPRANLYSIILNNRGPDGDMNRQFGDNVTSDRQKQIIELLKDLIAESDILLNLHEGSGFYRLTWENEMANPRRYGQSIIADTDRYVKPDGTVIELENIATAVLEEVNAQVENPDHRFLFNNHRTAQNDSIHKEQRLSASYYALSQCHIPAFGVECSKAIKDLGIKVHYHNLVIKAFMKYFDIIPQTPPLYLPNPEFYYLMIKVNEEKILRAVPRDGELSIKPGDTIRVEHIEGNYSRGFYCSVMGLGSINDLRKNFVIDKSTSILVRKDNALIGQVKIIVEPVGTPVLPLAQRDDSKIEDNQPLALSPPSGPSLLVEVANRLSYIPNGGSLSIVNGDKIKLIGMVGLPADNQNKLEVNFKGYVPPSRFNTGDDRGFVIDTAQDLRAGYGKVLKDGSTVYNIEVSQNRKLLASMQVAIVKEAAWDYILLSNQNEDLALYRPGQDLLYRQGDNLKLLDVKTNLWPADQLTLFLVSSGGKEIKLDTNDTLDDGFIKEAWQKGDQLILKWLHSEQTVGQINLKQKGN